MSAIDKRKRALRFAQLPNGCMPCISHRGNADGYVRVNWKKSGAGIHMLHRVVHLATGGAAIPEGHEIDHTCGMRNCCNPAHLRVLPRGAHLDLTNRTRWLAPNLKEA